MKPSLPRSLDLSSPALFSDRLGERHVETALKTSPLFPLSVCLSVCPSLARAFARSISAHQPFWRQMPLLPLSPAPDGIFFNRPFFMRMQNGGEHQTETTDSLTLRSSLSLFLSLSLSLSSSSNPLRRLSNSGRTEFERWSHRLSLSLSPSLPTERTVIKLASRIANWLGGRMIFNRIPSGLKERERLRSDHFHTNG